MRYYTNPRLYFTFTLKMSAQDRSRLQMESMKTDTCHVAEHYRQREGDRQRDRERSRGAAELYLTPQSPSQIDDQQSECLPPYNSDDKQITNAETTTPSFIKRRTSINLAVSGSGPSPDIYLWTIPPPSFLHAVGLGHIPLPSPPSANLQCKAIYR